MPKAFVQYTELSHLLAVTGKFDSPNERNTEATQKPNFLHNTYEHISQTLIKTIPQVLLLHNSKVLEIYICFANPKHVVSFFVLYSAAPTMWNKCASISPSHTNSTQEKEYAAKEEHPITQFTIQIQVLEGSLVQTITDTFSQISTFSSHMPRCSRQRFCAMAFWTASPRVNTVNCRLRCDCNRSRIWRMQYD